MNSMTESATKQVTERLDAAFAAMILLASKFGPNVTILACSRVVILCAVFLGYSRSKVVQIAGEAWDKWADDLPPPPEQQKDPEKPSREAN